MQGFCLLSKMGETLSWMIDILRERPMQGQAGDGGERRGRPEGGVFCPRRRLRGHRKWDSHG